MITIKSVKRVKLDKPVPVYDATNEVHHNFALANGIIIHNTAKKSRNPEYQEVLALKGKVLNAYKSNPTKIFENQEVMDILRSIGYDPSLDDPTSNLRVGKIILLSDADSDGYHINMLLLALIHKLIPEAIKRGLVYVIDAPLFTCHWNSKRYFGTSLQDLKKKLPKSVPADRITRIKGWGEVGPDVLQEIAFDPKKRKLTQIQPVEGDSLRKFLSLVGENVEERRKLLGV